MEKITFEDVQTLRHAAETIPQLSQAAFGPKDENLTSKMGLLKHRILGGKVNEIADKLQGRLRV